MICVVDLREGLHSMNVVINERGHYEMDKLKILKKWGNFIIKFDV